MEQTNFDKYPLIRIDKAPEVEVQILVIRVQRGRAAPKSRNTWRELSALQNGSSASSRSTSRAAGAAGKLRVIASIEDPAIIERILRHLEPPPAGDPPRAPFTPRAPPQPLPFG